MRLGPYSSRHIMSFSEVQLSLLTSLLDQMTDLNGGVPALKFRAIHWNDVDQLESLEVDGWIRRDNDVYFLRAVALPRLRSDTAKTLLLHIEKIYSELRSQYQRAQRSPVPLAFLSAHTRLSRAELATALRFMVDVSLWSAGWSTDPTSEDASVTPAEAVLKYESFGKVLDEVRSWASQFRPPLLGQPPPLQAPPNEDAEPAKNFLRAWPAIRACLQEFRFYDIKELVGLAGADVTATAHLEQKSESGGASKGQLMTAVDKQVGAMGDGERMRFLTILMEEVLRRKPESEEKLADYLSRLGWTFVHQTLVPLQLLDNDALDEVPEEAHRDLLKAAQRMRDGDLGGAISAACGAVDAATSQVYQEFGLGDPAQASFQERCRRAAGAKGVLKTLESQLTEIGWPQTEVMPFKKNLEGALNQGAYVMQTLRSKMGDVHGTKPILRSLAFESLRWAELIVGSLVERGD